MLYEHVKEAFLEKPIWLKSSLLEYLSKKDVKVINPFSLTKVLSYISYLFRNGPWKFTYVSFEYDPRTAPESVKYQVFAVGVNNKGYMEKKNEHHQSAPNEKSEIDCRSRNYDRVQLCEIQNNQINDLMKDTINKNRNSYHIVCSKKFGWLDKNCHLFVVKMLRDDMKAMLLRENKNRIHMLNNGTKRF